MTQPDEWKSPYDPPKQPDAPQPGQQPEQQWDQQAQPYPAQPYPAPPYAGQPYPYGAPYGYVAPPEKNALGVWSLVLGILSVFLLFSCLVGFLAAVPAVITGHLSRKAVREGQADNGGLALGGIITGWVTIGLTLVIVVGLVLLFSNPEFREGYFSPQYSDYE
ncbi:DUF4190 domain-containing protein [Promicromonospora sp. NPDC059942]|uniref:DUF4190 domain-containing protein n=1 Tax=Promicromonospora sp. NPDC059942 TaxID=3347009 RepID=UPI003665DA61